MAEVVCIGGACIDRKYHVLSQAQPGTSNPGRARRSFGGVARNVAENLARLRVDVALLSIVGDDENGEALLEHARSAGINANCVARNRKYATCEYAAVVHPDGELLIGVSDMQALDELCIEHLMRHWDALVASRWVFLDCNVSADALAWCIDQARSSPFRLAVDAVSEPKAQRLPQRLDGVDLLICNEEEAAAYLRDNEQSALARAQAIRARGAGAVILTRGARGLLACGDVCAEVPAMHASCVDATGAGDALIAATIFGLLRGDTLQQAAQIGSLCAALTIETPETVRSDLHERLLRL